MESRDPPRHALLAQLSGLTSEEMAAFQRWWPTLPPERRHLCLQRMSSLAEDDVELDFDTIFRLGLADADAQVREQAVVGLWESNDRTLVEPLMKLLKEDPAEPVRASAAISLGKFGALAEEGKILPRDGERIKEALLHVLENPRETIEVRRRALEGVAAFNTPRVQELIRQAYRGPEVEVRLSAIYAMGRTCDARWLPLLIKELKNPDPAFRYEAAGACAELGDEEVVPCLIPLLSDEDPEVQLAVIRTLGVCGGRLAKRALQRCLKSEDEAVRQAAEEALGQLDMEESPLDFKFPRP
ncbi:MAG: HEAT repeat domain-containing protein [Chloroflexi bacterium]|nr:HEAT repeat domain-containing protein [Chloroflexota bacterium]